MNIKVAVILILCILHLGATANRSAYSESDSLNVSLIKRITIRNDITVVLVCDKTKLKLNDPVEQKFVKIEIKGNELIIGKKQSLFTDRKIIYYLEVRDLENITVLDDANLISEQPIGCAKQVNICIKGDGLIDLELNAEKINVVSKGMAKISIKCNFSSSRTWLDGYGGMVSEYVR